MLSPRLISFLLDHLPPQMHLVLASREDPPLSLDHLRRQGALLELCTPIPRLSSQETATDLIEVMGLPTRAPARDAQ